MNVETADWARRVERLADKLTNDGDLRSPQWRRALCSVPRHELVPRYYIQDGLPQSTAWRLIEPHDEASIQAWLDVVYSDTTMVTATAELPGRRAQIAVSSSTKPDLMIRMLEELAVQDGHRVLEIGTGTGYNAALLSARLGDHNVFSVDVDADLVDTARDRLARIGRRPTLVTVDGAGGLPDHAPYDRLIATCSVSTVPRAWLDQVRPGGIILVDIEGALNAGNLVSLRRGDEPVAEGRFLPWWGRFMHMHDGQQVGSPRHERCATPVHTRTSKVDPTELDEGFRFLAQLHLPTGTQLSLAIEHDRPYAACLTSPDGSWCEVNRSANDDRRYHVAHGGTIDLWELVENAWTEWELIDAPPWHRFGLTVARDHQYIWLDNPHDSHTWTLPC